MQTAVEFHHVKTQAAARRQNLAFRAQLIAEMGWEPELSYGDAYVASTRELVEMVNEKRHAAGKPLTADHVYTCPDPRFT